MNNEDKTEVAPNMKSIRPDGRTWCMRHPTLYFDTTKYKQCYRCFLKEKEERLNNQNK